MALLPCRECTKDVSSEAGACPHCGAAILPKFSAISGSKKLPFISTLAFLCFPLAIIWIWATNIYEQDGEYARAISGRRKFRLSLTIFAIWAAIGLLINYSHSDSPGTQSMVYELPKCDDQVTVNLLKSAIANSPSSKLVNAQLLDVTELSEVGWSEADQARTCHGHGFTNGGETPITFTVKWVDRSVGKWWLQTVGAE